MPSGSMRGDAHDLRFRKEHAAVAAGDEAYCASCHKRAFCVDCHNGTQKPMDFHANDYVSIHPVDARRGTPDCGSCHRLQTFCTGCHSRMGVGDDEKTTGFQLPSRVQPGEAVTRRFHPEGWWTRTNDPRTARRSASNHSFEAQRNIASCASCHREEFCVGCHKADGANPHPASWAGSPRCKALAARAGRMCLRCHSSLEEVHRCD